jgi:hypothetical protein
VSDVLVGTAGLASLEFGVGRENLSPHLGRVARRAYRYADVGQQQPTTPLVVCQYLANAVRPAVKQVGT